jgi:hypothetical protein
LPESLPAKDACTFKRTKGQLNVSGFYGYPYNKKSEFLMEAKRQLHTESKHLKVKTNNGIKL